MHGFLIHAGAALASFAVFEYIAFNINNYWEPIPFLGLQLFSLLVALWFWSAVFRRFHDAGKRVWFPGLAILLVISGKLFILINWILAKYTKFYGGNLSNPEFEMGAAIWTAMFEPTVHAAFLAVALFFVFRPSQPGPNQYGPNPSEVPS